MADGVAGQCLNHTCQHMGTPLLCIEGNLSIPSNRKRRQSNMADEILLIAAATYWGCS